MKKLTVLTALFIVSIFLNPAFGQPEPGKKKRRTTQKTITVKDVNEIKVEIPVHEPDSAKTPVVTTTTTNTEPQTLSDAIAMLKKLEKRIAKNEKAITKTQKTVAKNEENSLKTLATLKVAQDEGFARMSNEMLARYNVLVDSIANNSRAYASLQLSAMKGDSIDQALLADVDSLRMKRGNDRILLFSLLFLVIGLIGVVVYIVLRHLKMSRAFTESEKKRDPNYVGSFNKRNNSLDTSRSHYGDNTGSHGPQPEHPIESELASR